MSKHTLSIKFKPLIQGPVGIEVKLKELNENNLKQKLKRKNDTRVVKGDPLALVS